jgi:hypothetical protein
MCDLSEEEFAEYELWQQAARVRVRPERAPPSEVRRPPIPEGPATAET